MVNQRWWPVTGSGYLPQIYHNIRISPVAMLDVKTHKYRRWNFVAISHTSWDICYFISTSGYRSSSLICHSPRHTAVFRTGQSCCLTSKHRYSRWNSLLSRKQAELYVILFPLPVTSLINYSSWRKIVFALALLVFGSQQWRFPFVVRWYLILNVRS